MRVLCIGGPADGVVHESHNPLHVMPYIEPTETTWDSGSSHVPIRVHHYQLRKCANGLGSFGWAYQHDCITDCGRPPGELTEENIERVLRVV